MKILLVIYCLLVSFEIEAQDINKSINKLINKYEMSDGSGRIQTSFLLAKEFIKYDTLFLRSMLKKKVTYDKWIENLQYGVFTVYESEDWVDDLLYKAYYEELKKLMLTKVESFQNDPLLGELGKKMKKKLEEIKIRFIN